MKNTFYITTPVYYVNANPHIGHSYTNIACDCAARYARQKGNKVFFLTGTDEHGQKIQQAAEKQSKTPKEFVDTIVPNFKKLWDKLNISYDYFIRTTDNAHVKAVQYVLDKLFVKGDLYQDEYQGWYCVPCETFWSESQAPGKICPDCGRELEQITESNYFFKISNYQQWLIDYLKKNKDFVIPVSRYNEVMGYLSCPLDDLCITRPEKRLNWGIKTPFSSEHVTYVWFDALINYISGCGYPENKEKFNSLWPADFHVIGKDILKPHTIYWTIMLKALGLQLPRHVIAHGWWMVSSESSEESEKMSKSKGNIIDPNYIADKFSIDSYRYFLMREIPFGVDGKFSESAVIKRINSDLANDLGNLVHRTSTMMNKYLNGVIPEKVYDPDKIFDRKIKELPDCIKKCSENFNFQSILVYIWEIINAANKYIEDSQPWILYKEGNTEKLNFVLFNLAEIIRIVALAVYPVMPETAEKIYCQLSMDKNVREENIEDLLVWGQTSSKKFQQTVPLFPRIELS